jgi:hypothetical protein
MSDESKPHSQNLESSTIRKAYSRPPTIRSKYRSSDIVQDTEKADYFDEKDFGNTDRYFFSAGVLGVDVLGMDFYKFRPGIARLQKQGIGVFLPAEMVRQRVWGKGRNY